MEKTNSTAEDLFSDGSRGEVLQSSLLVLSSPYSDKEEDKNIYQWMEEQSLILPVGMWLRVLNTYVVPVTVDEK